MTRDGKMPELTDEQLEKQILESLRGQIPADRMPAGWSDRSATYAALAVRLKADCLTFPDELPGPHGLVVEKVLEEMRLKDDQRNEVLTGIVLELNQYAQRPLAAASCIDLLKIFTLRASLQIIRERAQGFFYKQRVPGDNISDLGGEVVGRILRQLNTGKAPHGNTGSWCSPIPYCVWVDYGRKTDRNRVFLGDDSDAGTQSQSFESPAEQAIENLSIEELDPVTRAIIVAYRWGFSFKEIAASVGLTTTEVRCVLRDYLERS
jgi:DNA-directed RNA polymerase specialized sigma24 family protein